MKIRYILYSILPTSLEKAALTALAASGLASDSSLATDTSDAEPDTPAVSCVELAQDVCEVWDDDGPRTENIHELDYKYSIKQ